MRPQPSLSLPPCPRRAVRAVVWLLVGLGFAAGTSVLAQAVPRPELRKGDHVALVGNTLADRMQHDGWLETFLFTRFPTHDLVVRNLGFSGDELTVRLRSADFGSPDEWLTRVGADVVLAFFGYNESFAGEAGLPKFKADLDAFVKHTLAQRYSGKAAPRLVLFSPIAHENLHDPDLPDGTANNQRLALYTRAMAEVAAADGVPFVDLFNPTKELAEKQTHGRLTFNGIHLTPEGDRVLASLIDSALFQGAPEPARGPEVVEKVRAAVLEKNHYWFNRYRTVDGYSIFGGRADLRFTDGQTNRDVAQREMEVLDVMTANRDRKVWAAAQGRDLVVDDSNTPPFIPVKTNKPGANPDGSHVFLSGEEAIGKMTVAKGLKVNLFASEEQYPELAKPVQMTFDPRGRLWVAAWPSYPHWKPKDEMNDKLLVFEDANRDGKADRMTVFADGLHCPTGFELYDGGVIVAQAPDLVFLKDTDGDGRADQRVRILSGLDSADTHHTANSFTVDPGGALYFQEGTFHHTQVETPWGPPVRSANAAVYRFEPRSFRFEVYVPFGFANPHGHVFDRWGQDVVVDGTGANPYHGALFSGHLEFPEKHRRPPQVYQQRTRPCPGIEYLSSRHFPDDMQGNLLVPNVIGFQGILRYRIDDRGASLSGTEAEPLLSSTDPNFRPSDLKTGPDGAVYFLDWQNPIIGHMQHNLRDPNRDRVHGRIYRITAEGRPLLQPVAITGQPIDALLDLLRQPEERVRYRARCELGARDTKEVTEAARRWLGRLERDDPDVEHHKLEALWLFQSQNVVDVELLKAMLKSPESRARAAATRVLCYWRDRVPEALDLLRTMAADPYPRVRLEAVRAASFFTQPEALEVALISAEHPSDEYIEYTRGETLRALEPYWKKALADGRPIHFTSEAGARYFLRTVTTDELSRLPRSRALDVELLTRKGVRDEDRRTALTDLAKRDGKDEVRALVELVRSLDGEQPAGRDVSAAFDLVRLLTARPAAELAPVRADLEALATSGRTSIIRQLGLVALASADQGVDRFWTLGNHSPAALQDVLAAVPLLRDPAQQLALYPKIVPLLDGLPPDLAKAVGAGAKGTFGRYVRIELPGQRRTLTLAEVEVMSGGRNVGPRGKASQSSTSSGGTASKGIDGKTSGSYGDGGQTHTAENVPDPWWEVDLGGEVPIDAVIVWNRTDGDLGRRLHGYTLKVLDGARQTTFEVKDRPAPGLRATIALGGSGPAGAVRRAAMAALSAIRGRDAETFIALARFVRSGVDRQAAVAALQRVPAASWPKDQAGPTLEALIGYVRSVPESDRTTPAVLDALRLGESLASLLPRDESLRHRRAMGELGVRVLRLGTVLDQMLFDKDRLAARAGKPVEIVFENVDLMPHNFVLTLPGSLVEIGELAEATATERGALERGYIPKSDKVLVSSRLVQPRDRQVIRFTAPDRPGVYPYVCTYPGHWRRMYGAFYVVEDLEDYLADPESYLSRHPLPVLDDLLKSNRPRKEWTYEELASGLTPTLSGRSYTTGKQMFLAASCITCHKFDGVGEEIGPDLTKLDPPQSPSDILKNLLDPSVKIDQKYQTYLFETQEGRVVTGLVLSEKGDTLEIIENPLAKSEPVFLKKSDIADRVKSPSSLMPKGLLDKLTREEVLDLIAYVTSKGDRNHPVFQGGHEHHTGHEQHQP